ncbi:hypothetical protein FIBSPDRAFT_865426 [Athelia psychrophila]|uniref:RRM domain-containing protein n=1 Tax=Athelia psychrophila TaxID=1759441 RepID=A0A166FKG6_9AGAM|nr:hypothetical protein FIBSPDRAFT_865426 [Fibularhizoctonia sp. CBS 109695]
MLRISFAELRNIPREPRGCAAGYHTLFISDIPQMHLRECFGSFEPDIIDTHPRVDRSGKMVSGFVGFNDSSKAAEALHERNGKTFNGHMVNLSFALPPDPRERRGRAVGDIPQHKLFFSNFPHDEAGLRDCFDSFKSDIVSIYMLRDETGKRKGSGFIEFNSISKATQALHELDGKTISRYRLEMSFARPPKPAKRGTPHHTLFISDFPHGEASFRECIRSFKADIVHAYLPRDEQGKSKSYGFVKFNGISKATEALDELGGKTINGHMLRISFGRPREPLEPPETHLDR